MVKSEKEILVNELNVWKKFFSVDICTLAICMKQLDATHILYSIYMKYESGKIKVNNSDGNADFVVDFFVNFD